jgi:hypothetical protein
MTDRDTLANKVNGLDVNDWFKIAVAKEQENDALHTEIAELQSQSASRASMDDRDQLWQLMFDHIDYWDHSHDAAVDAILAEGWRPPAREITTPAERDALPVGTLVRSDDGFVAVRVNAHSGEVPGRSSRYPWDCIVLPVTAVYVPTEEADRG